MRYRRVKMEGRTYFFTLATHNRRPFLCDPNVELLRQAFRYTIQRHPMEIDAFVLLPDHLHRIWTLPEGDHNFSMRWRLVKSHFSRHCQASWWHCFCITARQTGASILATQILGTYNSRR